MDTSEAGGEIRLQPVFRGHGCPGVLREEGGGAKEDRGDQGEMGEEKEVCEGG